VWVKHLVYPVFRANIKTKLEQHRVKNVLKIRLPTSVGCRLAIPAVVVPKQNQAVPNAPVVMRVKLVLALVVLVNNVRLVNFVHPMTKTLLRARHVTPANTKKTEDKPRVTSVF